MLALGKHVRSATVVAVAFTGPPTALAREAAPSVRIRDGFAAATVRRALPAVRQRLARAECRRLLSDFTNAAGAPLQAVLDERAQTPEDYLATLILYDGSESPACSANVLAITLRESRFIFVCARRMAKVRNRTEVEAMIIHEMLHTLGLGEDPPSPAEITSSVARRCGL